MTKILFAIQLPPPVHGASMVNKTLYENARINNSYEIDLIEIQLAKNMQDMGMFSVNKFIHGTIIMFKLLGNWFGTNMI